MSGRQRGVNRRFDNLHMARNLAMGGGGMMMSGMGRNMPGMMGGIGGMGGNGGMGTMNNFPFCGNGYIPNSMQGGMQQWGIFGNFQAGFAARPPPYGGAYQQSNAPMETPLLLQLTSSQEDSSVEECD